MLGALMLALALAPHTEAKVHEATTKNFMTEVVAGDKVSLIQFSSAKCEGTPPNLRVSENRSIVHFEIERQFPLNFH